MSNVEKYEPKVGDWVKCVGGTAAVGEVGRIIKVTAKMVVVFLFLSQESRNKKKVYVQKVSAPIEDQAATKTSDDDATGDEENKPPSDATSKKSDPLPNKSGNVNGNVNILITVSEVKDSKTDIEAPGLTQENKERFLAAAWDHLQEFCPVDEKTQHKLPAIDGRGMVLRNMRQMIFKTTSPMIASNIVNHYVKHTMSIEGVICHVSYSEKSVAYDNYVSKKDGVPNTFSSNNNGRFGKATGKSSHYHLSTNNASLAPKQASGRSYQYRWSANNSSYAPKQASGRSYQYRSSATPPKKSFFDSMKPAKN